jgi:hypothetical protein
MTGVENSLKLRDMKENAMSKKTYKGSCHCQKVRFEADIDFSNGTGRCNCSFCSRVRNWSVMVKPADFRLLTNPEDVSAYKFRDESLNEHQFCKTCGVRTFTKGYVEEIGGHYVSISIPVLEGISPQELAALKIQYMDGLHNNWFHPPEVTSYL